MELRDGRHSADALAAELGDLLPFARVDVDEAIHVADAEALDAVLRLQLPLSSQTVKKDSLARVRKKRWT